MLEASVSDERVRAIVRYWSQLFTLKFHLPRSAVVSTRSGVMANVGEQSMTLAWKMMEPDHDDARGEFVKAVERLVNEREHKNDR